MGDDLPVILDRMFDCVNGSIKWSVEQVKSACPWRHKKSTDSDGGTEGGTAVKEKEDREKDFRDSPDDKIGRGIRDGRDDRDGRDGQDSRDSRDSHGSDRTDDDKYRGQDESSRSKRQYDAPSQICPPPQPSCCFIKMQDPCRPCCCEPKLPPCPPTYPSRPDPPREPTCGCDLCKKGYPNDKCCDRREEFRRATSAPRYFERA